MNVNFWKVDVHINWTIVYIEMVLEVPLIASFILRCDAPKVFYGMHIYKYYAALPPKTNCRTVV